MELISEEPRGAGARELPLMVIDGILWRILGFGGMEMKINRSISL